ncbi:MAG: TolC family protein [Elusimicrobiota bacterium]|jgi:outer membrane protein TolC|nr:TolC family protein [Elusimicrobiota bacterium]
MKKLSAIAVLSLFFFVAGGYAQALSLNDYLKLVAKNNLTLKSINANIISLNGQIAAVDRAYSAVLNANAAYSHDGSKSNMQLPVDINTTAYDASISKLFVTGTTLALGFNNSIVSIDNPAVDERNIISPYIQVQQSLLKNFNGAATKANIEQARATIRQTLYQLEQSRRQILTSAKLAYFNLSYAKTLVEYRKTSLGRSNRVYEWMQNRYRLDLAEKADYLQSQAAVKNGELNLQSAQGNEVQKRAVFNQLINEDESVNHEIADFIEITDQYVKDRKLSKTGIRLDVLAASEAVKAANFNRQYSKANAGADLSLIGQYGLGGLDTTFSNSLRQVTSAEKPSYSIGLKYSLPLDFSLRKTMDEGYEAAAISKQRALEAAILQEKTDWQQALYNWENALLRFKLSREVRDLLVQYDEENHKLLRRGRTTTNNVIQGEQSLDDAQVGIYTTVIELMTVYENAVADYTNKIINE